jgi:hypothetical protein
VTLKTAGEVPANPAEKGYDPTSILMTRTKSAREIFSAEPRDDPWAGAIEQQIGAQIRADLAARAPAGKLSNLECRTSSCEVTLDGDAGSEDALMMVLQAPLVADTVSFDTADDDRGVQGRVKALIFFTPDHRMPADHSDWYQQNREATFAKNPGLRGD